MLFETYPVYCHRMFSGKNGFQTLDTFGRIAYTCAYFRPIARLVLRQNGDCHPFVSDSL